jgi:hypothetical protein
MLVALLAALLGVQVVGVSAQRAADHAAESRVQLARDVELIRYYDELLTMSARFAAASGDHSYVDRYERAIPKLDRVMRHARSLVPDPAAEEGVRATARANAVLIEMESESFRQLDAGNRAYAVVTSRRYARDKSVYRRAMDVVVERLQLAGARQQA